MLFDFRSSRTGWHPFRRAKLHMSAVTDPACPLRSACCVSVDPESISSQNISPNETPTVGGHSDSSSCTKMQTISTSLFPSPPPPQKSYSLQVRQMNDSQMDSPCTISFHPLSLRRHSSCLTPPPPPPEVITFQQGFQRLRLPVESHIFEVWESVSTPLCQCFVFTFLSQG